jgi:hypothetical protein
LCFPPTKQFISLNETDFRERTDGSALFFFSRDGELNILRPVTLLQVSFENCFFPVEKQTIIANVFLGNCSLLFLSIVIDYKHGLKQFHN